MRPLFTWKMKVEIRRTKKTKSLCIAALKIWNTYEFQSLKKEEAELFRKLGAV